MRLVVTGAGGMVGSEVSRQSLRRGWECIAFTRSELDVAEDGAVSSAIATAKPDVVINAGAYTAVDRAEAEEDKATLVNGHGAANVARAAHAARAAMIHISTDYVFDGEANEPYRPSDKANPINAYGRSKLAGEIKVRSACRRHLIVRTSWVYSNEGHNFMRTMLRLGAAGNEIKVVDDQHGSPTCAADVAAALITAAAAMCRNASLAGTYHFTNSGVTTWYDFARTIFEMRGLTVPVRPISTAEYSTPARRPLWSVLDCTSFETDFGVAPRPWRAALRETLDRIQ